MECYGISIKSYDMLRTNQGTGTTQNSCSYVKNDGKKTEMGAFSLFLSL